MMRVEVKVRVRMVVMCDSDDDADVGEGCVRERIVFNYDHRYLDKTTDY